MAEAVTREEVEEVKPDPWFYTWTKEFQLGEGGETPIQRWKAVCSFADNSDVADVESLLRLAVGGRHVPATDWIGTLEGAFRDDYPAFTASTNARELQVLAACCLQLICQDPSNGTANVAALASATAAVAVSAPI